MQVETNKIRVMVVDDSAVMRKLISNLLARDSEIEVVATAIDGIALQQPRPVSLSLVTGTGRSVPAPAERHEPGMVASAPNCNAVAAEGGDGNGQWRTSTVRPATTY